MRPELGGHLIAQRLIAFAAALLLLAGIGLAPAPPKSPTYSFEEIVAGLTSREQALRGTHVKFTYQSFAHFPDHDELCEHCVYDFHRRGSEYRYDKQVFNEATGEYEGTGRATWNGIEARTDWRPANRKYGDELSGTIESDRGGAFKGSWQTILECNFMDEMRTLPSLLTLTSEERDKLVDGNWKALGSKTVNSRVVWGATLVGKDGASTELWLDPLRDFATLEITARYPRYNGSVLEHKWTDIELMKSGNVWVPKKAKLMFSGSPHPEQGVRFDEVEISSYETGLDLPDDLFVLNFEAGTALWNGIEKSSSIVGKGKWLSDSTGRVHFVETGRKLDDVIVEDQQRMTSEAQSEEAAANPAPRAIGFAWLRRDWPVLGLIIMVAVLALLFRRNFSMGKNK